MEEAAVGSRRKRKEEGKRLKRQRIQESGGVRPRQHDGEKHQGDNKDNRHHATTTIAKEKKVNNPGVSAQSKLNDMNKNSNKSTPRRGGRDPGMSPNSSKQQLHQHRFGRVMEQAPCRGKPRIATVSIAIPGSIVANCQTRELKTQITGQIARAATIYHVDEIIVFDDCLSKRGIHHRQKYRTNNNSRHRNCDKQASADGDPKVDDPQSKNGAKEGGPDQDPHAFMARILQYAECPQYLRRHFFPMHPDLQFVGLLPPVDAPHHVREEDRCSFREGVVLDKTHATGSLVNCGIRGRPVHIGQKLQPGIRCTVQLDPASYGKPGPMHGTVVSPNAATRKDGTYWGYTVRLADSIQAVLDQCPYPEGKYDLTIGTSERGNESIDDDDFTLFQPKRNNSSSIGTREQQQKEHYQHALIVFGGVAGIEECVDADERMKLSGSNAHELFDKWINVCPFQGSRTIRSEEAVLITLARLSPLLGKASADPLRGSRKKISSKTKDFPPASVQFSDESLSEESSDDDSATSDK